MTVRPAPMKPLPPEALRPSTDPDSIGGEASAPAQILGLVGQGRAVRALDFGMEMAKPGFNLYAMDLPGADRRASIMSFLIDRARSEPPPDDWVYVNNFALPEKPRALRLPPGTAVRLRDIMGELVADLVVAIPALFESDDYKARHGAIDGEFEEQQEQAFHRLGEKAQHKSISVMRTPVGFAFAPIRNGKVIKPEEFEALGQEERERIQTDIAALQEELRAIVTRMPALEKARRDRIRELNKEMAGGAVGAAIREASEAFAGVAVVQDFLREASEDILANIEAFLESASAAANAPIPVATVARSHDPRFRRYGVNVIVGEKQGDGASAPVVYEANPTFQNIVGRIEHIAQMGALLTDFMLIRPGALHRANGGCLILDAREILSQPFAWPALKRILRSGEIRIASLAEQFSLISTTSLEPDPIPLDIKVVLFGDRWLYYLLSALDPDFAELFKVEVDFDDVFERSGANVEMYAQLIASIAAREKLRPLDKPALARVIDETARLAEDAERLSLRIAVVTDLLREADHWAARADRTRTTADDVAKAVDERRLRSSRLYERSLEGITRNILRIDTTGAVIGQVNGLSVSQLGAFSFGRPARITARTRLGAGRVVDIEREVELGGPLHSKGVLILSGFLSARYAQDAPVSMQATLVFEQSYGGIDGDSASSAELYALLSSLSEVPIRQSFAVTGSVNQFGEVQAIGGVNEKIEGFFDVCAARGLTGEQGVLIPAANVRHLMLREDVVDACRAGCFAIYAIASIDEGIELLTGAPAGARQPSGDFPADSVNGKVEVKLRAFAAARRRFAAEDGGDRSNGEQRRKD